MSDLTSIEKTKLEKYLGMGSGYVLDFPNRTFQEAILENIRIDIYDKKYAYAGGSKANHLRAFWKEESNYLVGKLIEDFIEVGGSRGKGHILNIDSAEKPLHKKTWVDSGRLFLFHPSLLLLRSLVHRQTKRLTCSVCLSVKLH